jgi:hypothetical protein
MSFFKLYKPREYGYRYIYYDPKKEAKKEREKRLKDTAENGESGFKSTLHRGSFRQQAEKNKNVRAHQSRQSNIRLIIILFILLALLYYFLR